MITNHLSADRFQVSAHCVLCVLPCLTCLSCVRVYCRALQASLDSTRAEKQLKD